MMEAYFLAVLPPGKEPHSCPPDSFDAVKKKKNLVSS
jgi:hypothetical protein